MSRLFTPITLRSLTVRNRLWVAPMCQYSVEARDGVPGDWQHVHLAQFASGGAGLILTEATAVTADGRISPEDTGIWNDAQRDAWAGIVDAVHARGAAIGVQLAHAGRKASTWRPFRLGDGPAGRGSVPVAEGGWQTSAPSAIAYQGYATPEALDEDGIGQIIEAFRSAARRALDAGFDTVEVHAAHGYLLHEFLSPLSNHRQDRWGGSLRGRARLTEEVVRAIRTELGDEVPILVRLSAIDAAEGGLTATDVAQAAGWLQEAGADFFDVSTAGLVAHQQVHPFPGYQVPEAETVAATVTAPVGAVGLITDALQAEAILQDTEIDVILAGREFLRDPHFGLRAADELGVPAAEIWPPQYVRAAR